MTTDEVATTPPEGRSDPSAAVVHPFGKPLPPDPTALGDVVGLAVRELLTRRGWLVVLALLVLLRSSWSIDRFPWGSLTHWGHWSFEGTFEPDLDHVALTSACFIAVPAAWTATDRWGRLAIVCAVALAAGAGLSDLPHMGISVCVLALTTTILRLPSTWGRVVALALATAGGATLVGAMSGVWGDVHAGAGVPVSFGQSATWHYAPGMWCITVACAVAARSRASVVLWMTLALLGGIEWWREDVPAALRVALPLVLVVALGLAARGHHPRRSCVASVVAGWVRSRAEVAAPAAAGLACVLVASRPWGGVPFRGLDPRSLALVPLLVLCACVTGVAVRSRMWRAGLVVGAWAAGYVAASGLLWLSAGAGTQILQPWWLVEAGEGVIATTVPFMLGGAVGLLSRRGPVVATMLAMAVSALVIWIRLEDAWPTVARWYADSLIFLTWTGPALLLSFGAASFVSRRWLYFALPAVLVCAAAADPDVLWWLQHEAFAPAPSAEDAWQSWGAPPRRGFDWFVWQLAPPVLLGVLLTDAIRLCRTAFTTTPIPEWHPVRADFGTGKEGA